MANADSRSVELHGFGRCTFGARRVQPSSDRLNGFERVRENSNSIEVYRSQQISNPKIASLVGNTGIASLCRPRSRSIFSYYLFLSISPFFQTSALSARASPGASRRCYWWRASSCSRCSRRRRWAWRAPSSSSGTWRGSAGAIVQNSQVYVPSLQTVFTQFNSSF